MEPITYEVCYHVGDGIYSVNMLQGARNAVSLEAEAHAQKFGYDLVSIKPITADEVAERRAKGMPFKKIIGNL